MLGFYTEIEGEERAESFIRPQADEGSKGHQEDTEQSCRRDIEVG